MPKRLIEEGTSVHEKEVRIMLRTLAWCLAVGPGFLPFWQSAHAEEIVKKAAIADSDLELAEPLPDEEDFLKQSPAAWRRQLAEWKKDLRVRPKEEEVAADAAAREKIAAIRDPQALLALEQHLFYGEEEGEKEYVLTRAAFLPPLLTIQGKRAVQLLARVAVEPGSSVLRVGAAHILAQREDAKEAIPALVKYLKGKKHREFALLALANSELTASTGGVLPDERLFMLLVAILKRNDDEILNESHFRMYTYRGSSNGQRYTGKDFEIHKDQIDALKRRLEELEPDPNVHKVLATYTGQDFGYDQIKWLEWFADVVKASKEHKDDLPAGDATVKDDLDPKAVSAWHRQIAEWSKEFKLNPKPDEKAASDTALAKIQAVADPAAVPALKKALHGQRYVKAQVVYLEPIAKSGGKEALGFLVKLSVEHKNDLLRTKAAEAMAQMPSAADATPQFIRYLRTPKYTVYAARALSLNGLTKYQSGKLPDPQLFSALVNSLFVPDEEYIPVAYWFDAGPINPRAVNFPGSRPYVVAGHFYGTVKGTVRKVEPKANPVAEACLKEYTQQSYGYDQQAWKDWYQKERREVEKSK